MGCGASQPVQDEQQPVATPKASQELKPLGPSSVVLEPKSVGSLKKPGQKPTQSDAQTLETRGSVKVSANGTSTKETRKSDNGALNPSAQANGKKTSSTSLSELLNPTPNPPVDVTQRGVTILFLQQLLQSGSMDRSWSMQEVADRFVRPYTTATSCCLFDLVPQQYTGTPRFFVSCAATHKLGGFLQLLQEYLEGSDIPLETPMWLEVTALNPQEGRGALIDNGTVGRLIAVTQLTLFAMDHKCSALTDLWSLYELWQTCAAKGPGGLRVIMPMVEATKLKDALKALDVTKATMPSPEDTQRLQGLMLGNQDAAQVSRQLREALVGSALHEAEHTTATDAKWAAILNKASELALADERFVEAEIMGRQALETRTQLLGRDHPDTMRSVRCMAACLTARGRRGEAGRHVESEPLYRIMLDATSKDHGPDHPDTIDALQNLALCVDAQGRRVDAEPMYRQVLAQRTKILGPDHPDSLKSLGNLAGCIKALAAEEDGQSRVAMAEAMYRQALEAYTRVMGEEHPDTIHAFNNLAICLDDQGRRGEAEPMFFRVLEVRTRLLGREDPTTADAMYNLGGLLEAEGEYDEALRMYQEAKAVYLQAYGPNHPETEDAGCRVLAMMEIIEYDNNARASAAT